MKHLRTASASFFIYLLCKQIIITSSVYHMTYAIACNSPFIIFGGLLFPSLWYRLIRLTHRRLIVRVLSWQWNVSIYKEQRNYHCKKNDPCCFEDAALTTANCHAPPKDAGAQYCTFARRWFSSYAVTSRVSLKFRLSPNCETQHWWRNNACISQEKNEINEFIIIAIWFLTFFADCTRVSLL